MKWLVKVLHVPRGTAGPTDFSQSLDVCGWDRHPWQKEQHKQRQEAGVLSVWTTSEEQDEEKLEGSRSLAMPCFRCLERGVEETGPT